MQLHHDVQARTSDSETVNVHVDVRNVITSHFLGAGVEWSAYPWWDLTDSEWNRVCQRLEFMRLPITRVMQSAFYYWTGQRADNSPTYHFESVYQRKLRMLLDWCESHGTHVILGEWGAPTDLDGNSLSNDDPRWAKMVGDFLADLFARREYRCIRYFNLINEPHGEWSTIAGRFDEWKRAIMLLRAEFNRRGLAERVAIVGPDADAEWLRKTLDDDTLRATTGLYDIHWYFTRDELDNGLVEQRCRAMRDEIDRVDPAAPFVIGELGLVDGKTADDKQPSVYGFDYGVDMADAAIQLMRGGSTGFVAWYLDDAMHFLGDGEFVRRDGEPLPADAYARRKVWGLWNSLGDRQGTPKDAQLRPWFFTWSLLSRYFPAGCQIVAADVSGAQGVAVAVALVKQIDSVGISLVIVNRTNQPQRVMIRTPQLPVDLTLSRYDYFDQDADDRPDAWPVSVDEHGADVFPVPNDVLRNVNLQSGLPLELPGRGVTIVTSLDRQDSLAA